MTLSRQSGLVPCASYRVVIEWFSIMHATTTASTSAIIVIASVVIVVIAIVVVVIIVLVQVLVHVERIVCRKLWIRCVSVGKV